MRRMKQLVPLVAMAAVAAACSEHKARSLVLVHVSKTANVGPLDNIVVSSSGARFEVTGDAPQDVGLYLSSSISGRIHVVVDGQAGGDVVARAETDTTVTQGEMTSVSLTLVAYSAPDGGTDGGAGGAAGGGGNTGTGGAGGVGVGGCGAGMHNDGAGNCVPNTSCPADHLTDGSGSCVPMAGVNWTPVLATKGVAVAGSANGTRWVLAADTAIYTSSDRARTWASVKPVTGAEIGGLVTSADGTKLIYTTIGNSPAVNTSTDSGASWSARNTAAIATLASSSDAVRLVGGAQTGAVMVSSDFATTWSEHTFGSSNSLPPSVASSADGRRLVAGLRGSYIVTSSDYGVTWDNRASSNDAMFSSSADGLKLTGAVPNGFIYTSENAGQSWTERATSKAWSAVATAANGVTRIAAVDAGYLFTSHDGGVTWTQRGIVGNWHAVAMSADGTTMVAAGDQVYVSTGPVP